MEIKREVDYPDHENLDEYYLPDWFEVYMDLQLVFAEAKEKDIKSMWDGGDIRRHDLVEIATNRQIAAHAWAEASRRFYDRFGRDYTKDRYRVTIDGSGPQWYLATTTELLLRRLAGVETEHKWNDDNTEVYIFVVNENQGET